LEDIALLTEDEKSIIKFQAGDKTVTGTIPIIQELCAQFPFLVGKDAKVVGYRILKSLYFTNF
jgi:glutamyl-tRNA synthetase